MALILKKSLKTTTVDFFKQLKNCCDWSFSICLFHSVDRAHDTSLLESSFNSHPRDTYALLLLVSVFLNCCAITGVKVNCSGLTGLSGSVELSSGTVSSCRWVFWGLSRSPSSELPTGWFLSTMDCGCRQRQREREREEGNWGLWSIFWGLSQSPSSGELSTV